MACSASTLSLLLTFSLLLLLTATSVPEDEISAALTSIRNHGGYSLFANAVATSDLYYTLTLSLPPSSSFTLFAIPDPSVYSLDVTSVNAEEYVSSLRRHVVPRRLSLLSLRSAPVGAEIPTLEAGHTLRLRTRLSSGRVSVGGVEVTSPGIFYSRSVAVHGLAGSVVVPRHQSHPPASFSDRTVSNPSFRGDSLVVPRHQPHPPPDFSDRTVSDTSEAISPVVPRHQPPLSPSFSDRSVSDPTEAVSPVPTVSDHLVANSPRNPDPSVVPRHQSPNLSERTVSDTSEAISPVVPRHQSLPPISSDRTVSDHFFAHTPRNSDPITVPRHRSQRNLPDHTVTDPSEAVSPVVPRHQSPERTVSDPSVANPPGNSVPSVVRLPRHQSSGHKVSDHLVANSPRNSGPTAAPRHRSQPSFSDRTVSDHLVANSPRNPDHVAVPRHRSKPSPNLSDRTVSDHLVANSPVEAPAYVAGSVKARVSDQEMLVGHVIMARGNTYRLENQENEPMLTCPYL